MKQYLLQLPLLLSIVLVAVSGCEKSGVAERPASAAPAAATPAAPTPSTDLGPVEPAPPPPAVPGQGEVLIHPETQQRRKVISRHPDVYCADQPGGPPLTNTALPFLMPFFVIGVAGPETAPTHYEIATSTTRATRLGWVREADVIEWPHRVGVQQAATLPMYAFAEPEDLRAYLETNDAAKAVARLNPSKTQWMPWPVIETAALEVQGNQIPAYKLFLAGRYRPGAHGSGGPVAPYTPEEKQSLAASVSRLDVVFAVDNTQSTTPFVAAIRQTVNEICRKVHALPEAADIAFGLVLYRDFVDSIRYDDGSVLYTVPLTTDLNAFLNQIAGISAATQSSEDWEEAVFYGLREAIAGSRWRDSFAREVILIGDAGSHPPGHPKNPEGLNVRQIVQLAESNHVTITSLAILGRCSDQERAWQKRQFTEMAESGGGGYHEMQSSVEPVVAHLREVVRGEAQTVNKRALVTEALFEKRSPEEITGKLGMPIEEYTNIVEFLVEEVGIDMRRIDAEGLRTACVWAAPANRGIVYLDREVFIEKRELCRLISELLRTQQVALSDTQSSFVPALFVQGAQSREMSFWDTARSEPLDIYLRSLHIPWRPDSKLRRLTQSDIQHASQAVRQELAEYLLDHINLLSKVSGFKFEQSDGALWGWIKEAYLP